MDNPKPNLEAIAKKWKRISCDTSPIDRAKVSAKLLTFYFQCKVPAMQTAKTGNHMLETLNHDIEPEVKGPPKFVWCRSPMSMVILRVAATIYYPLLPFDPKELFAKVSSVFGYPGLSDSVLESFEEFCRTNHVSHHDGLMALGSPNISSTIVDKLNGIILEALQTDSYREKHVKEIYDKTLSIFLPELNEARRENILRVIFPRWGNLPNLQSTRIEDEWGIPFNKVDRLFADSGHSPLDKLTPAAHWTVKRNVFPLFYGQSSAMNLCVSEFLSYEKGKFRPWFGALARVSEDVGWWLPARNVVFVSERPTLLRLDERGWLSRDEAPAVRWSDGWEIYALHGIEMPKDWVLTPASKLNPRSILEIRNVDIRREAMRKVGMERFIQACGAKVLDKCGNYELLEINDEHQLTWDEMREMPENIALEWPNPVIRGVGRMVYLKMLNPSIGVWHVEGVHPNCKSVEDAINWRAGDFRKGDEPVSWNPLILT